MPTYKCTVCGKQHDAEDVALLCERTCLDKERWREDHPSKFNEGM